MRGGDRVTALRRAGLATPLLDLLAPEEGRDRRNVFDVALLGGRLGLAARRVRDNPDTSRLELGLFGASTGAATALRAAAEGPGGVGAVVSRGGRPDLAMAALDRVRAPMLLVVGGLGGPVVELNRRAHARLGREKESVVVPGAATCSGNPGRSTR